jgi:hypothetical protein
MALARFLRPFSCHGRSLSPSASRAACAISRFISLLRLGLDYAEFIARLTSLIPRKGQVRLLAV